MEFKTLSHASLLLRAGDKTLLTDPWLLGSCYWRSWWNYPPVDASVMDNLVPDVIYLTHVHWDHFHGPTLKKFARDTLMIIPYERSPRVYKDLRGMGFTNIHQLPHGCSYKVGPDFEITSYQFSSPWGDSALVIEAEGVKLLNANDCKIMGGPLRHVLKKHGYFDFAFRSHSSANDNRCYDIVDEENQAEAADAATYAQSFFNFIRKVEPQYAIPFASNHCHLHRDVFHFNEGITTPVEVLDFVESSGGFSSSEVKIMLSGDSWSSEQGFFIAPQDYFTNRDRHLKQYLNANAEKLEVTYQREQRTKIGVKDFERFFNKFFAAVPSVLRRKLRNKPIVFKATTEKNQSYFLVDLYGQVIKEISIIDCTEDAIVYEAPAIVLKQALAANMFSHVGISKRAKYRMRRGDRIYLEYFNMLLAAYEYDVLPLRKLLSWRTIKVYTRRWRELILYLSLLQGKLAGKSNHQLEAENLR